MYAVPFYTVFLIVLLVYAIISFLVAFYLSYFFIAYTTFLSLSFDRSVHVPVKKIGDTKPQTLTYEEIQYAANK